jgi:hypothetical protein
LKWRTMAWRSFSTDQGDKFADRPLGIPAFLLRKRILQR